MAAGPSWVSGAPSAGQANQRHHIGCIAPRTLTTMPSYAQPTRKDNNSSRQLHKTALTCHNCQDRLSAVAHTDQHEPAHGHRTFCRFHKLNDKTWCTRSMTIGSAEGSKDLTLRLLKGWCVQAGKFKKKKDHARMALRPADALPDEVLDSL